MKVSVIVPVYEQWHLVPELLNCLTEQSLPRGDFEVLIVDNGSKNLLVPQVVPDNVHVMSCERPGSYAARNRAAVEAIGDYLAFTDADCQPSPTWLENLLGAAANSKNVHGLWAGAIDVVSDGDDPNIFEAYDMVRGIPQERYVGRGYAATANLLSRTTKAIIRRFTGCLVDCAKCLNSHNGGRSVRSV